MKFPGFGNRQQNTPKEDCPQDGTVLEAFASLDDFLYLNPPGALVCVSRG